MLLEKLILSLYFANPVTKNTIKNMNIMNITLNLTNTYTVITLSMSSTDVALSVYAQEVNEISREEPSLSLVIAIDATHELVR